MLTLLQNITVLGRDSTNSPNRLTSDLKRKLMALPGDSMMAFKIKHVLVLQLAPLTMSTYTELSSPVSYQHHS